MNKYKKNNDIDEYIESQEVVANRYVMKCFTASMLLLVLSVILNLLDIFIFSEMCGKIFTDLCKNFGSISRHELLSCKRINIF